jgi:hypothetical protein
VDEVRTYRLVIDAYSPETMLMGRLAEYMADFAAILGERPAVHLVGLEPSCLVLVHKVEAEAAPKVRERIALARRGEGSADAMTGIRSLNRRLREDTGEGFSFRGSGRGFAVPQPRGGGTNDLPSI